MRCSTLLAIMTVVLLYLVMGALVFSALETPREKLQHGALFDSRNAFLLTHNCVQSDHLQDFIQDVVSATKTGVDTASTSLNYTSRWNFHNAFFFCGTIITTIGFGNLSPITEGGQLFCIFYALVGIPMFGILLAGVGDHMGTMLRRAVGKIETLFLRKAVRPTNVRIISAVFSILIGCVIFLGVPTLVFKEVEHWTWLEAGLLRGHHTYYSGLRGLCRRYTISPLLQWALETMSQTTREGPIMYKPLVWLWIVFGLAYFASVLNMIGNWLRVLSKKTRAEMEELKAYATDWTQNIQNMSVDFRIPVPLDLNDIGPFQFQRRRRKKRRRSAHPLHTKVGYIVPGIGSPLEPEGIRINGHMFNNWSEAKTVLEKMLEVTANSMSRLELPPHSSRTGSRTGSRPGSRVPSRPASRSEARSLSRPESRRPSESGSSSWSESKSESASESDHNHSHSDSRSDTHSLPMARPVPRHPEGQETTASASASVSASVSGSASSVVPMRLELGPVVPR
ncbi:hypothetical protein ACEWY4_026589 [Coilia grayii]|uniref:Potassium channel domain-containing protein n=1 Tax=Coilia grayii TaxID=363190 RepID=A0ABD1ISZ9_9TELE